MRSISKRNKNRQIDSPRVLFSPQRSGRRRDGLGHFEFARAACLCLSLGEAAARIFCQPWRPGWRAFRSLKVVLNSPLLCVTLLYYSTPLYSALLYSTLLRVSGMVRASLYGRRRPQTPCDTLTQQRTPPGMIPALSRTPRLSSHTLAGGGERQGEGLSSVWYILWDRVRCALRGSVRCILSYFH